MAKKSRMLVELDLITRYPVECLSRGSMQGPTPDPGFTGRLSRFGAGFGRHSRWLKVV